MTTQSLVILSKAKNLSFCGYGFEPYDAKMSHYPDSAGWDKKEGEKDRPFISRPERVVGATGVTGALQ